MSQPSKDQWNELRKGLASIHGNGYLRCDGFLVSLHWERSSKTAQRYVLAIYVDGYIKGGWMAIAQKEGEEIPEIARRFYRLSRKQVWSAKHVRRMETILGKRYCREHGYYDKRISCMPYWNTVDTCVAHLKRYNQDIEILDHETYWGALDEKKEAEG